MNSVLLFICAANLFIVSSMMMQMMAVFTNYTNMGCDPVSAAASISVFAPGLFLLGPISAYLIDRYGHKKIYVYSMIFLATLSAVYCLNLSLTATFVVRFFEGAAFGLSQAVLGSTILNDLTKSEKRTYSDYTFVWTSLLAIPTGIAVSLFFLDIYGYNFTVTASIGSIFISAIIVLRLNIPFRAPINVSVFGLDRFWQKNDFLPFVNLMILSLAVGYFISRQEDYQTFIFVAIGLLVAYPVRLMVFEKADVRAEIVSGMILTVAALLIPTATSSPHSLEVSYLLFGAGIGLASSRFLLYFLKLTGHCQRGTAQNTFLLSRECGYALGFIFGALQKGPVIPVAAVTVSLLFYLLVTHPWFLKHNDRFFKFKEV